MSSIHISLAAEELFKVGNVFPITNSLMTTWIVMVAVTIISFLATRKVSLVPGVLQSGAEILVDGIWNLYESVLGDKTKYYFTLLATLFVFIIFLNWAGLFPGAGTVGFFRQEEGQNVLVPFIRGGTADLNTTLALAIIAVVMIQISGFATLGLGYLKKFINFSSPIGFFVGLLELVSEVSRIISFAFRLFGNIFAGEVLLTVIAFFIPLLAPLPFIGLEFFVGFIQALVFSMLTAVFLSLATQKAHH